MTLLNYLLYLFSCSITTKTVSSALLTPNFTDLGFGIGRAPPGLAETLLGAIVIDLNNGRDRLEQMNEMLDGPQPRFIDRQHLVYRVSQKVKTHHVDG